MEILIISGLSGGGKSKAASFLEDIGYYTVDNLPAEMMMKFAGFCAASSGRYDRVALVYDVRSGEPTDMLIDTLEQLKASGVNCRMLFLEADTPTIINRYKETRRMHPLQAKGLSVEEAVRRERALMQPVRDHADFVLDTSSLSTAKLRSELLNLFGTPSDRGGLNVSVLSFGFKHGIPIESDLVFDVRFMPNPYYVAELKNKTGLDRGGPGLRVLLPPDPRVHGPAGENDHLPAAAIQRGGQNRSGHRHRLHRRPPPLRGRGP